MNDPQAILVSLAFAAFIVLLLRLTVFDKKN